MWEADEGEAERLRGEIKATEVELRARLKAEEEERAKRERQMDILRQSLRILAGKRKNSRFRRNLRA